MPSHELQRFETKLGKQFLVTMEVNPPKGTDVAEILQAVKRVHGLVDAINVTDGSGAIMRACSLAVAKAVLDATRPYKIVTIKGAILGRRAIDADGVTRLATLPSRDVLLAQVAGAIAAPLATLAGLFEAPLRDIAGGIGALADQGVGENFTSGAR